MLQYRHVGEDKGLLLQPDEVAMNAERMTDLFGGGSCRRRGFGWQVERAFEAAGPKKKTGKQREYKQ